jgi:hypothetical protein
LKKIPCFEQEILLLLGDFHSQYAMNAIHIKRKGTFLSPSLLFLLGFFPLIEILQRNPDRLHNKSRERAIFALYFFFRLLDHIVGKTDTFAGRGRLQEF